MTYSAFLAVKIRFIQGLILLRYIYNEVLAILATILILRIF